MIKCPICEAEVKTKKKEGHDLLYACTNCVGEWSLDPNAHENEHAIQKAIMEVERKKVLFKRMGKFKSKVEKTYQCPSCNHICTASQMSSDHEPAGEDHDGFSIEYICPKCSKTHGSLEKWNEYTDDQGNVREDLQS